MHEIHEVSRRARRKDTLSTEDLGILLQWHWKYGRQPTFQNFSCLANVSSRETGTVQCGREETEAG